MRVYWCLAVTSCALLAATSPASAASILFNGSARVACFGETNATQNNFSKTFSGPATDSGTAHIARTCEELGSDDELHLQNRGADLEASIADNILTWRGIANGAAGQTDAGTLVNYLITDLLIIDQTGTFDIRTHVSGTGSGTPNNCFLYSFTANVKLNNISTALAPVSITPCAAVTDNLFSVFATAGTQIPIITTFSGRAGLSFSSQVIFDSLHTGSVGITSSDGGVFHTESGLTYASQAAVPEPGTIGLLSTGVAALLVRKRHRGSSGR